MVKKGRRVKIPHRLARQMSEALCGGEEGPALVRVRVRVRGGEGVGAGEGWVRA